MMESGPVAGIIGAGRLAALLGIERAIGFDMGGTTAKASLITKGIPAIEDGYTIGGEVQMMFAALGPVLPLVRQGKVKGLAVSTPKRTPLMPELPAVAETPGLAGFESDLWYGMLAPAKTPPAIIDKVYQESRRILLLPETRNRFEPTGATIVANSPAEFAKIIQDDFVRWGGVIKAAGVQVE